MKTPKHLRILGHKFQIIQTADFPEGQIGESCLDTRTIKIHLGLNELSKFNTFWHEWAHSAMSISGLGKILGEKNEEAVAELMGTALSNLFIENDMSKITFEDKISDKPRRKTKKV